METLKEWFLDLLSNESIVEFDYIDGGGTHHGRCVFRSILMSRKRITKKMQEMGYTNIHIN